MRTTNILERALQEVLRRTQSMNNLLTKEANADRILYG
jgi:hypothetical protein